MDRLRLFVAASLTLGFIVCLGVADAAYRATVSSASHLAHGDLRRADAGAAFGAKRNLASRWQGFDCRRHAPQSGFLQVRRALRSRHRQVSTDRRHGRAARGTCAVLLRSGKVLVAGGWTGQGGTDSAELYDPATGRFTTIAKMTARRGRPGATMLANGDVLITGGVDHDGPGGTFGLG
jgi:hypothetical protein